MSDSSTQRLNEQLKAVSTAPARKALLSLLDSGSFCETDAFAGNEVVCGSGLIGGARVCVFSQSAEDGMSLAAANKISKVYDLALATGVPVVGFFAGKGGKINEGTDVMQAFAKAISGANALSGVVPQIAVIAGTCSGSNAVLASMSDITVMCSKAEMYLNAPSLLGHGEKLGTADACKKNGQSALNVKDINEAAETVKRLLTLLPQNNLSSPLQLAGGTPSVCPVIKCDFLDAEDKIKLFPEFAPEIETILARINGTACGVVVNCSDEKSISNSCCVKAARFVRMCDSFSLPVVTIVDADGFEKSRDGEAANGVRSAALLTAAYAEATTAKISVIAGHACGGAFTALAAKGMSADAVYAFPDAVISPLNPEASAIVLYSDRLNKGESIESLAKEFAENDGSVFAAAQKGYVDEIIEKPQLREKLSNALSQLASKRVTKPAKKHTNLPF